MKQQLLDTLEQIAGKENIHPNEPMSRHTTFRVGGPADVLVTPEAEKLRSSYRCMPGGGRAILHCRKRQ